MEEDKYIRAIKNSKTELTQIQLKMNDLKTELASLEEQEYKLKESIIRSVQLSSEL